MKPTPKSSEQGIGIRKTGYNENYETKNGADTVSKKEQHGKHPAEVRTGRDSEREKKETSKSKEQKENPSTKNIDLNKEIKTKRQEGKQQTRESTYRDIKTKGNEQEGQQETQKDTNRAIQSKENDEDISTECTDNVKKCILNEIQYNQERAECSIWSQQSYIEEKVVDDSSASGNEDDAFSSENNWHRNEMSEGSESFIDDSDADPDYVDSGSDDSNNSSDFQDQHKRREHVDYISDSDSSNIIPVQPIGVVRTDSSCTVGEGVRRKHHEAEQHLGSTSETIETTKKTLIQSTTAYREDGKRNVDKKHFCVFCEKYQLRIGRHLQTHTEEREIQLLTIKNKKEKEKVLTKLRLDGDYKHNLKVRESGVGYLILPRRPSVKDAKRYSFQDYKPCEVCKGFYLSWELWRHMPNCPLVTDDQRRHIKTPSRTMWQQRSHLMLEASMPSKQSYTCSEAFMDKIVSSFNTDEISLVARNDSIIMKLGDDEFEEKGLQQKKNIKQKMRLLGRLVIKMREITFTEDVYLDHFLKSNMFDFFIDAARELSGIYVGKMASSFKTPSVATKLGQLLKQCCSIIKGRCNRSGDDVMLSSVQRLTSLIDDEWDKKVTAIARRSRQEHRRNKQIQLPKETDLALLNKHLEEKLPKAEAFLFHNKCDNEGFQRLASLVLSKIIVFNRRRSGEASKILMSDYMQKPDWHDSLNDVIMNQLSVLERKLVHRLDMIMIRGKRERNVIVIITPEIKRALNLLVECREKVGISHDNPYLFPRSSGVEHIEGHICLRSLTSEIKELEYPERICSTSLRKFTATVVQMLNLNSGELEWLSNHLGHTVEVHKEYYRNQESAVELGKIASMLMRHDRSVCTENDSNSEEEEKDILEALSDENATRSKRKESVTSNALYSDENHDDHPLESPAKRMTASCDCNNHEKNICVTTPASKGKAAFPAKARKKTKVNPWTEEQLAAMHRVFAKNLRCLVVPNKEECERARKNERALMSRGWKNIKFRVNHEIQRLKKK